MVLLRPSCRHGMSPCGDPCLSSVWREFLERTIVAAKVATATSGFKRIGAMAARLLCGNFGKNRPKSAATLATAATSRYQLRCTPHDSRGGEPLAREKVAA